MKWQKPCSVSEEAFLSNSVKLLWAVAQVRQPDAVLVVMLVENNDL
jgi:hypothetical protein